MQKIKYYAKTGKENMKLDSVEKLLKQSYWAKKRKTEVIEKSMEHSLCYGVFLNGDDMQVGFARVITDYSTTYYICDVIVDVDYRGIGIGKMLMNTIDEDKENLGLLGILTTKDAQELYQKFGFKDCKTFMLKRSKSKKSEK